MFFFLLFSFFFGLYKIEQKRKHQRCGNETHNERSNNASEGVKNKHYLLIPTIVKLLQSFVFFPKTTIKRFLWLLQRVDLFFTRLAITRNLPLIAVDLVCFLFAFSLSRFLVWLRFAAVAYIVCNVRARNHTPQPILLSQESLSPSCCFFCVVISFENIKFEAEWESSQNGFCIVTLYEKTSSQ